MIIFYLIGFNYKKEPFFVNVIDPSFLKGLEPYEFFFGAITGRDALMDTALRTPKSGYLYRRLANALQDIRVEYDETVRDGSGNIMQFKYGEDGKDAAQTKTPSIPHQTQLP